MSNLGYKVASGCLVTLIIPSSARTNEDRSNVKHKKTAKYRCSKAFVVSIVKFRNGKTKKSAASTRDSRIKYRVGKTVRCFDKYEKNSKEVCASGIHYFKTKLGAYVYYCQQGPKPVFVISLGDDGTIYEFHIRNHKQMKRKMKKEWKKLQKKWMGKRK